MSKPDSQSEPAEVQIRQMTRRSFATGAAAAAAGLAGYSWLRWFAHDPAVDDHLPWPLRRVLEWNERVARQVLGNERSAPEFAAVRAREPKVNGHQGLAGVVNHDTWRLQVSTPAGPDREFRLAEIQALPKYEMVTELKCVEGWSEIVRWSGARLIDFLVAYDLGCRGGGGWRDTARPDDLFRYVQLATPDRAYYVGLDMPSALHPQTLLCWEMNGQPLTPDHGAPLRLVITVKYGIKNIKRIGHLRLLDERPADYWAERGYDWYAGL